MAAVGRDVGSKSVQGPLDPINHVHTSPNR
jgi:hypothetical protein